MSKLAQEFLSESTKEPKKSSLASEFLGESPKKTEAKAEPTTEEPKVEESKSDVDAELEKAKAGYVTVPEIRSIMTKYGVPEQHEEELKEIATFFGAKVPGYTAPFMDVMGLLDSATFNAASKYLIEKQDKEENKQALDELRQLVDKRKTLGRRGAEFVTGVLTPAAAVKGAKGMIAIGAGTGAVQGTTTAPRGEELEGAVVGGALGGVLVGALSGLGKVLRKETGELVSEAGRKLSKDEVEQVALSVKQIEKMNRPEKIQMGKKLDEFLASPKMQKQTDAMRKIIKVDPEEVLANPSKLKEPLPLSERVALLEPWEVSALRRGELQVPEELAAKGVTPLDYITSRKVVQRLDNLAKDVKAGKDGLKGYIAREGEDFALSKFKQAQGNRYLSRYIQENNFRDTPKWGMGQVVAATISDVKPLARRFDERYGSDFERIIDRTSQKLNQISELRADALTKAEALRKQMNEAKVSGVQVYDALRTKNKGGQVPEEIYNNWKNYWEDLRASSEALGLPVAKLSSTKEDYVPLLRSDYTKYIRAINNQLSNIPPETQKKLLEGSKDAIADLRTTDSGKKLLAEMIQVLGREPKSAAEFNQMMVKLTDKNDIAQRGVTQARALMQRGDVRPPREFLEDDPFELAKTWVNQTLRHAALRDELQNMQTVQIFAKKMGDDYIAGYIDRLRKDIVGTRLGTESKGWNNAMKKLESSAIERSKQAMDAGNPVRAAIHMGTAYIPEFLQAASNAVYSTTLGGIIPGKAHVQNVISPLIMNTPELGAVYGTKAWAKAAMDARKLLKGGVEVKLRPAMAKRLGKQPGEVIKTTNLNTLLLNEGIIPKQWTGELQKALRNGIKKSIAEDEGSAALNRVVATAEGGMNIADWATNVGMAMFEKSEQIARAQTYMLAKRVAKDLVKSDKGARNWLKDISSPSYKRAITDALKKQDIDEVDNLVQQYFQSSNMFNYDRANMSEAGRYMGPLFSTFSKWPTHMAGKAMNELADRKGAGAKKLLAQLAAPWALAKLVDEYALPDDEKNPYVRHFIGSKGLAGATPADALTTFLTLDLDQMKTPAVQAASKTLGPLFSPDEKSIDKISRAAADNLYLFNPTGTSWILRTLGRDIPNLMGENVARRAKGMKGKSRPEKEFIEAQRLLRKLGMQ